GIAGRPHPLVMLHLANGYGLAAEAARAGRPDTPAVAVDPAVFFVGRGRPHLDGRIFPNGVPQVVPAYPAWVEEPEGGGGMRLQLAPAPSGGWGGRGTGNPLEGRQDAQGVPWRPGMVPVIHDDGRIEFMWGPDAQVVPG